MNIALIAHDRKKQQMGDFILMYQEVFKRHTLIVTGTIGRRIIKNTGLSVTCCLLGESGGTQIASRIGTNQVDILMRLCDMHQIPFASNKSSALLYIKSL